MTPVIVEFLSNGTLYFITGAAGGSKIITATLQSLWHVLDQRMTPIEAIRSPRFYVQLVLNQVSKSKNRVMPNLADDGLDCVRIPVRQQNNSFYDCKRPQCYLDTTNGVLGRGCDAPTQWHLCGCSRNKDRGCRWIYNIVILQVNPCTLRYRCRRPRAFAMHRTIVSSLFPIIAPWSISGFQVVHRPKLVAAMIASHDHPDAFETFITSNPLSRSSITTGQTSVAF